MNVCCFLIQIIEPTGASKPASKFSLRNPIAIAVIVDKWNADKGFGTGVMTFKAQYDSVKVARKSVDRAERKSLHDPSCHDDACCVYVVRGEEGIAVRSSLAVAVLAHVKQKHF